MVDQPTHSAQVVFVMFTMVLGLMIDAMLIASDLLIRASLTSVRTPARRLVC